MPTEPRKQPHAAAPHSTFAQLHAQLVGAPELAAAGVGAARLLNLYPVTLESYAQFFWDFYTTSAIPAEKLYHEAAAREIGSCLFNVQLAMMPTASGTPETWANYRAIFQEDIPLPLRELAAELMAHANRHGTVLHGTYDLLRFQMWPLLKTMWLLSRWDKDRFEEDLRPDSKEAFATGLRLLAAEFYGLQLDSHRAPQPAAQPKLPK